MKYEIYLWQAWQGEKNEGNKEWKETTFSERKKNERKFDECFPIEWMKEVSERERENVMDRIKEWERNVKW